MCIRDRFEGVSQFYPPDLRVFREVHCSFSDGVSCVLGSAGSGKTTLMNLIAGLTSPSQGEVWVLGKNIHRMTPQKAAKVRFEQLGILNATNDFYGELTLLQNILLPFTLRALSLIHI